MARSFEDRTASHRPKKALGQHFLTQPDVARRIALFAGLVPEDVVLEIGPGLGRLTTELIGRVRAVWAVEIDADCLAPLSRAFGAHAGFHLFHEDILNSDLDAWRRQPDGPNRLVTNLPYRITGPLIERLLAMENKFPTVTLLLQKEVAERLAASPGGREYGALTLAVGFHYEVVKGFTVRPGAFHPPPQVMSQVTRWRLRDRSLDDPEGEAAFQKTVRAAFSQRRKKIVNALASGLHRTTEEVADRMTGVGLDPGLRAEALGLEAFLRLAHALFD